MGRGSEVAMTAATRPYPEPLLDAQFPVADCCGRGAQLVGLQPVGDPPLQWCGDPGCRTTIHALLGSRREAPW